MEEVRNDCHKPINPALGGGNRESGVQGQVWQHNERLTWAI